MKMLTPIRQAPDTGPPVSQNDPKIAQIIPFARTTEGVTDLERQINRIDALKVLIRTLLDHFDDLTQPGESGEDLSLQAVVRRFEVELIRHALIRTGGKQRQAARLLGEKKTTLNAKILRYGIRVEQSDSEARSPFGRGQDEG